MVVGLALAHSEFASLDRDAGGQEGLVALRLELVRELRASRGDDPAVDEDVDDGPASRS